MFACYTGFFKMLIISVDCENLLLNENEIEIQHVKQATVFLLDPKPTKAHEHACARTHVHNTNTSIYRF